MMLVATEANVNIGVNISRVFASKSEKVVAGVDGCPAGWFVVTKNLETGIVSQFIAKRFAEIITLPYQIIAVDMPIGFLDHARSGGRKCDVVARKLLGSVRSTSVFTPPARRAIVESNYLAAVDVNMNSTASGQVRPMSISRQAFAIVPKMREVDMEITAAMQSRVFEIHPELCFYELNGSTPIKAGKRTLNGFTKRLELLITSGFSIEISDFKRFPKSWCAPDDILDAHAACWSAERIAKGTAISIPSIPEVDSRGLRMEMWR